MKIAQILTLAITMLLAPMAFADDASEPECINTSAQGWIVKPGFANIQYGVAGVEVQTTVGGYVYSDVTDERGAFEFPDIITPDGEDLETILVTVRDDAGETTNSSVIKTNVGEEDPQLVARMHGWTGQKS